MGPRPGRLALQPDGAALWVTLEDGGVGRPRHGAASRWRPGSPPGPGGTSSPCRTTAASPTSPTPPRRRLSVIDAARRDKLRDVAARGRAHLRSPSRPWRRAAYVASAEAGTSWWSRGRAPGDRPGGDAEPGLGAIRFAPGGRLAFVVNPRNRQGPPARRGEQPDRADRGDRQVPTRSPSPSNLAYVRQRGSEIVLMIPLKQVGEAGRRCRWSTSPAASARSAAGQAADPADSIVRAPGAHAVLVANPADKAIYYYKEGMAAPMGSFQNYSRQPRAVLVVDRSLQGARRRAAYETVAPPAGPGRYQVAFFLDSPRAVHCFPLTVAADPELVEKPGAARSRLLWIPRRHQPGGAGRANRCPCASASPIPAPPAQGRSRRTWWCGLRPGRRGGSGGTRARRWARGSTRSSSRRPRPATIRSWWNARRRICRSIFRRG